MSEREEELHLRLQQEDEEYKRLCQKHSRFEERLKELQERHFLKEEEKIEERKIKKQKLLLKDRMKDIRKKYTERSPA